MDIFVTILLEKWSFLFLGDAFFLVLSSSECLNNEERAELVAVYASSCSSFSTGRYHSIAAGLVVQCV